MDCVECVLIVVKGKKINLCVNWRGNSGRKNRREGERTENGTVFGDNY